MVNSFADHTKQIENSCHICKGTGVLSDVDQELLELRAAAQKVVDASMNGALPPAVSLAVYKLACLLEKQ